MSTWQTANELEPPRPDFRVVRENIALREKSVLSGGYGRQDLLTPLMRELLSAVQEICRPQAAGWQERMADRLAVLLYGPFRANSEITSEEMNVLAARIGALERSSMSSTRSRAMGEEVSNYVVGQGAV